MARSNPSRLALSISVATLIEACGGSQPPIRRAVFSITPVGTEKSR